MATTKPRKRKVNPQFKTKPAAICDLTGKDQLRIPISVKLAEEFHKGMPQNSEYDEIHEPQHYKNLPNGVQCWDVIQFMPANISHAIKYLWRQGEKPGQDAVKELKKSIQWIQHEIDRLEGNYPKMGK